MIRTTSRTSASWTTWPEHALPHGRPHPGADVADVATVPDGAVGVAEDAAGQGGVEELRAVVGGHGLATASSGTSNAPGDRAPAPGRGQGRRQRSRPGRQHRRPGGDVPRLGERAGAEVPEQGEPGRRLRRRGGATARPGVRRAARWAGSSSARLPAAGADPAADPGQDVGEVGCRPVPAGQGRSSRARPRAGAGRAGSARRSSAPGRRPGRPGRPAPRAARAAAPPGARPSASGTPPIRVATTGSPCASASVTTIPKLSPRDGSTTTSARSYAASGRIRPAGP